MRTALLHCTGVVAVLLAIALPVVIAQRQQAQVRNFRVVRAGTLYRSGQLTETGLRQVLQQRQVRTVVNLREGTDALDLAEEAYCRAHGVRFVRIPPLSWIGTVGNAPIDRGLKRFLDVVRNPANQPVLIHCQAGIHRTGLYVAFYRMDVEGWSKEEALSEMIALGYDELHKHADVLGYLASYQPAR